MPKNERVNSGSVRLAHPPESRLAPNMVLEAMRPSASCEEELTPNHALQPTAASVACGSLVAPLLGGG